MVFVAEYTDTFNGEANYSWLRRRYFETVNANPKGVEIMKMAREAMDLEGIQGRWSDDGHTFTFKPYGMCTVLMVFPAE